MSNASCNNSYAYNFDTPVNRRNTYSTKWDSCAKYLGSAGVQVPEDIIPMWIADMDIRVAPPIIDALKSAVEHGIYGYSNPTREVEKAVAAWLEKEHEWSIDPSSIVYTSAAMTGLHFILRTLTQKGDAVVTYEPTYPPIMSQIQECNRHLIVQSLQKKSSNGKVRYAMDFTALEEALKDARVFVLCNPHNPTGTVWTYEELATIVKLCKKHNVIICSDDVHADVVYAPHTYKSVESVAREITPEFANNIITLLSPNKVFNTGGIKIAMMIIPDEAKRNLIAQKQRTCLGSLMDIFGITTVYAAYSHGAAWKTELTAYLMGNRDFLTRYMKEHCDDISLVPAESTYLAWLDFSQYMAKQGMSYGTLKKLLIEKARVGLSAGNAFGKSGENHMRLNFGCPRTTLEEGLTRISQALFSNGPSHNFAAAPHYAAGTPPA